MRFGLVARGEARGLGNLAHEIHRNLLPDRTLLVEMGDGLARGFPIVHEFPGTMRVPFVGGTLDEGSCRRFLSGIDVVLMLETPYDWRFIEWANEERCATVILCMPEFWSPSYPHPTRIWNPTGWRHDTLPAGSNIVPVPVALDRLDRAHTAGDGRLRVLHVGGHKAIHDRNGTHSVVMALRRVARPMVVTIRGQDGRLGATRVPKHVEVRLAPDSLDNYWDLYADQDVLVMPRRYGGLCLPVQEGLAAGLPVVMPDVAPNPETWPIIPVPAYPHGTFRCAGGDLPMITTSTSDLATTLDMLADNPEVVADRAGMSRDWAARHSWDALRPFWLAELASAALAGRRAA